ncbi:MAG: inositol monophosphatase [Alphaproteobacteria bacterium]|nr:inositol monophosphatase [Alphaproteobacteria bacterium]
MTAAAKVDPTKVQALIRQAAEDIVLPRFNSLATHEIIEKAPGDLVTVADIEAEHFLTDALSSLLPGSRVVGEEAYARDPDILKRFDLDAPVWLIDPVDGTKNFTKASETFCMMVALVEKNRPVMGWIHDPIPNRTAFAAEGEGAWLDGIRMHIPSPPKDSAKVGLINTWYFEEPKRTALRLAARERFGELVSLSCAGQDFLAQTLGTRHFSFYRRLWPWDHAPGTLLIREAGGFVARIDDEPYRAGERVHGLLSAPNEAIWQDIRDYLLSTF